MLRLKLKTVVLLNNLFLCVSHMALDLKIALTEKKDIKENKEIVYIIKQLG